MFNQFNKFLLDIQVLYFIFNDDITNKLPKVLKNIIKFVAFDNFDYSLISKF